MMEPVIRVMMDLMDLMYRIRLKPITKAVDLRTMISDYKVHTARGPNESPPLNKHEPGAYGAY